MLLMFAGAVPAQPLPSPCKAFTCQRWNRVRGSLTKPWGTSWQMSWVGWLVSLVTSTTSLSSLMISPTKSATSCLVQLQLWPCMTEPCCTSAQAGCRLIEPGGACSLKQVGKYCLAGADRCLGHESNVCAGSEAAAL